MPLPEERRRAAFAYLIAAREEGLGLVASREIVTTALKTTQEELQKIEWEGFNAKWPPLRS